MQEKFDQKDTVSTKVLPTCKHEFNVPVLGLENSIDQEFFLSL